MHSISYETNKIKPKFIFLSIKKNILPAIFCIFTICLVIFSKSNLIAAKDGLILWANNVVPSLLPFFITTELLSYTNVVTKLGKILNPIMRPLFHVPGIGSYALLMGIISGYPTGAKIVVNLRNEGLCTKEEAERMLAFSNNSGPLFILGTVGIALFENSTIGFLLLFTHILACLSVGTIFRFWKFKNNSTINSFFLNKTTNKEEVNFSNLGDILGKSILSSIKTIVVIGGFVVLFSVILSILKSSNAIYILGKFIYPFLNFLGIEDFRFATSIVSGFLELTNGVMQVASIACKQISINIIICAFLLGFGGISILLQVYSIISKSDISIKAYFIGKLLHGTLAAFYTFLLITYLPIFNLNL